MTVSIQKKIEELANSNERSTKLIANFSGGYADGWYMAVRESFRLQLDIKYTTRIEKPINDAGGSEKRQVRLWTQGPRIAFDKGHIFYDTPLGCEKWDEVINHVKLACIVINGKPNDVKKEKSPNSKKKINKLIEGFVVVEFLIPNHDKTKLIKRNELKMSQNKFVELLMRGES